ncbi:O-antigen polymerase [Enterobacter quasiroggenkampii]|uniref:O-antigen polymerase n=1 Tax=Enterobacter quasiroggenkampii TaxID=2497436 RepID=UPI0021D1B84B|nr:O-antigen polymerase [Enterobacter quasiroggenkampii]MCU6305808.1 oligosaccharide repeat unit polymerase [Enterobacter quasiroggenkampii]MCU6399452.1 oligosaccharide repeat unit polymerase [Enterobacter quasiroggenkampii]
MESTLNFFIIILSFIPGYYLGVFRFKRLNYYCVLYWSMLLFCVIGSFIIHSGVMDSSFFIEPIANKTDAKTLGLFITTISFFIFFLSAFIVEVLCSLCSGKHSGMIRWENYYSRPMIMSSHKITLTLSILSSALVLYYIISIYPAPLFMAFQGASADQIAVRRLEVTKNYSGIGYFKTLAGVIPIILSYYCFIAYLRFKKHFLLFVLITFVSILTLTINGEKAPLVFYFLGLLVSYSSVKKISKKVYLLSVLLIFSLILIMYVVLFQFDNTDYLLYILVERLFIAQEAAVFYAADYFSSHSLLGLSSMDTVFNKILNVTSTARASEIFMYEYLPGMVANGGWNVNGFFAHETFSNFGYLGIVLGSMYGGIVNGLLCIYFRTREKTLLTMSFYSFYIVSVTTVLSSFNAMLFNTQLILVFIIYLILSVLDRRRKHAVPE